MENREKVTVQQTVNLPVEKAWEIWTEPKHIQEWNNASDEWQTTDVVNDLKVGGKFSSRMGAKDGSAGFDFGGTYDEIDPYKKIVYTMGDGREVHITFMAQNDRTVIQETFYTEDVNPVEMQKEGWQSILDRFKMYAENLNE